MRCHSPESLTALATRIFVAAGWPEDEARECADHLVLANLSGHDSHGVAMIPVYIGAFSAGLLRPENRPVTRSESAPFLVIDANLALGQPTANAAIRRAIAMAEAGGACILNLLNAHHIGRVGHYAETAAAAGLVSLFWVNVAGRAPIVAPHGARQSRFGTNPHTVGVPNGDAPLILDFATSRMAHGKARVALNAGRQVPEGYLLDHEGNPTTDPASVFGQPLGALLSFGEHKGAGIGVMAEILGAALGGGPIMPRTPPGASVINSMLAILIDPGRLDPNAADRTRRVEEVATFQRAARPRDGVDKVRSPGDREREIRAERRRDGIPLDDGTWQLLREAAARVGVSV